MWPALAESAYRDYFGYHLSSCLVLLPVSSPSQTFVTLFSGTTHYSHSIFGMQPQLLVPYRAMRFQTSTTPTSCLPTWRLFTITVYGKNFRNTFLSNYLSQPLDIWYASSARGSILYDIISDLSAISFLFTDARFFLYDRKFFAIVLWHGAVVVVVVVCGHLVFGR